VATGKQTVYDTASKSIGVVYLLVDCSGSMADRDKMAQARRGAVGFAKQARQKGYAVGVIRFESSAERIVAAQSSVNELEACVSRMAAGGSTNLADAIQLATQCISDASGERVMCVITDGYPDDVKAALSAARQAAAKGIDIMALGTDDADDEFLQRLVTRKELQARVSATQLEQGMVAMVKLLPDSGGKRESC
jgi:Mg-chelatase subunit ChlD